MRLEKSYLWFALPAAAVVVWVAAFYLPVSARAKASEREFARLRQEGLEAEAQLKNVLAAKKLREYQQEKIKGLRQKIPSFDEVPGFVREITATAKRNGLTVTDLNVKFPAPQSPSLIMNPLFEIGLAGTYLEMGRFLDDVERKDAFGRILSGRVAYRETSSSELKGNFVIEFKVWKGTTSESK